MEHEEIDAKKAASAAAAIIGRLGGLVRSAAKREASRRNGLKGGRPKKRKRPDLLISKIPSDGVTQ
jgi:hypothetical protein